MKEQLRFSITEGFLCSHIQSLFNIEADTNTNIKWGCYTGCFTISVDLLTSYKTT